MNKTRIQNKQRTKQNKTNEFIHLTLVTPSHLSHSLPRKATTQRTRQSGFSITQVFSVYICGMNGVRKGLVLYWITLYLPVLQSIHTCPPFAFVPLWAWDAGWRYLIGNIPRTRSSSVSLSSIHIHSQPAATCVLASTIYVTFHCPRPFLSPSVCPSLSVCLFVVSLDQFALSFLWKA